LAAAISQRAGIRLPSDQRLMARQMIIRHRHKGRFVIVPNGIFHDPRLSLAAKGLLAYLLSLPADWEVRHDQLQRKLEIGRKLLNRALKELVIGGYVTRDEFQGRDENNRFATLNYVVSDVSSCAPSDVHSPMRARPLHKRSTGNNKEEINTDSTKPFPKPLSTQQAEAPKARQDKYSEMGERARAAGSYPVYVGSDPHKAWCAYRGRDGMPGFVDQAIIGGKLRQIIWMPTVFPPKVSTQDSQGEGGTETWED
jgi:hypothetical protein